MTFYNKSVSMLTAITVCMFPFLQLKVQCPHVLTALSCRSTEFSHEYPSGEPMFPSSPLKQVFASLSSKLFYHILLNWAWWVLGVALLLPSYTDVTTKRVLGMIAIFSHNELVETVLNVSAKAFFISVTL